MQGQLVRHNLLAAGIAPGLRLGGRVAAEPSGETYGSICRPDLARCSSALAIVAATPKTANIGADIAGNYS